ncbi:hypothetical protein OXX79_007955 [Metschnikowia pulcherrima]
MDSGLIVFSLEYTCLVNSDRGIFESNIGLWKNQSEWSSALIPYNVLDRHSHESIRVIDNMSEIRRTAQMLNHNGISDTNHIKLIEPQLGNQSITISINGSDTFVNNSKSELLKAFKRVSYAKLDLARADFERITPEFLQSLDSAALRFGVEILISDYDTNFHGFSAKSHSVFIYLLGDINQIKRAEIHVSVLVDTLLNRHFVDRLQIPMSTLPSLGGFGMSNLVELMRESNVKVHLPYFADQISACQKAKESKLMSIWLTSKRMSEISLAKEALLDLHLIREPPLDRESELFTQEVEVSKAKFELIALYNQQNIHSIMLKHDTCARKALYRGSQTQTIIVQGQTATSVQAAATDLNALSHLFYQLDIKFTRRPSMPDLELYLISLVNFRKTCVLSYNDQGISLIGNRAEIRAVLKELVSDLENHLFFFRMVNDRELELCVKMEVASDQKEFMSGKKNGKIMKILSSLCKVPSIHFQRLNDFNFTICSRVPVKAGIKNRQVSTAFGLLLRTMCLLESEFPAEVRFNIPEVFHKSIIGNAGSIIQSIMKKYNVFIQFSRHETTLDSASPNAKDPIFFNLKRRNNVLIKCPMKNSKNIMLVKYEIDQLVQQCWQNTSFTSNGISVFYNGAQVRLLKSHFILLIRKMNFDLQFVMDLETNFNAHVAFPKTLGDFEGGSTYLINIKGNDNNARLCAEKLASLLPKSTEFEIACGRKVFADCIDPQDFREIIILPFKLILETETSVEDSVSTSPEHGNICRIILSSYSDNFRDIATSQLTKYLMSTNVKVLGNRDLDYTPITFVDGVISSTKQSPRKSHSKSPHKSPSKSLQDSPQKASQSQFSSASKNGSPRKTTKKPLKVITNKHPENFTKQVPALAITRRDKARS